MKNRISKIFTSIGIPLNLSPIILGYVFSTLVSFLATPLILKQSQNNPLPVISLTIFSFLSLFDLGFNRTTVYIFSKLSYPIKKGIKLFIAALISYPIICVIAFRLLLLNEYANYPLSHYLHLSFIISLCSIFNLLKGVTDSVGLLGISGIFRPIQIILIIINILFLFEKPFYGILITFLITLYIAYFTLQKYKSFSLEFDNDISNKKIPHKEKKFNNLNTYLNLLFSSVFLSAINVGERFIIPWLGSVIVTTYYFTFQVYFSKIISIGTLICTSYYSIFIKKIRTNSYTRIKDAILKSCFSSLIISSLASIFVYLIMILYLREILDLFGFFPIMICLIGGVLNTVNCQLATFIEASGLYKYRTITFFISSITSIYILIISTRILSVSTSFMFYWFFRSVLEFIIFSYFIIKILKNIYSKNTVDNENKLIKSI